MIFLYKTGFQVLNAIVKAVGDVVTAIANAVKDIVNWTVKAVGDLVQAIIAAGKTVANIVEGALKAGFAILKKIIEACGSAQSAFQMLMLEHMEGLAQASATAISNIKFDKIVVWENGASNGQGSNTASFLHNMARAMPPMMQVLRDVGGVEVPEFLAKLNEPTTAAVAAAPSSNGHVSEALGEKG